MAVINNHKSFEQSLRSASPFAPLLRPNRNEIHKGCTGKAHGCGTPKSRSYSSQSDSSSEVSPAPSVERQMPRKFSTSHKKKESTDNSCESLTRGGLQRRDSLRSNKSNSNDKGVDSKPPWHNVYTAKLSGLKSMEPGIRRVSTTNVDRSKKIFRNPSVLWPDLYERAKNQKLYGGSYLRCSYCEQKSVKSITHQVCCVAVGGNNGY